MIQMMKYYKATNNLDVDILCLGTYLRKSSKNKKTSAREISALNDSSLDGLTAQRAPFQHLRTLKYFSHFSHNNRHLLWKPSFFNSLVNMFHQVSVDLSYII